MDNHQFPFIIPSLKTYNKGCRCTICKKANAERQALHRQTQTPEQKAKTKEYMAQYYANNSERHKEHMRAYRAKHLDTWLAYDAKRDQTPARKEQKRRSKQRWRARKYNAEGSHTIAEWQAILEQYKYQCAHCGTTTQPLAKDHIIPLSKGGSDYASNLQPLCGSCNSSKGTKLLDRTACDDKPDNHKQNNENQISTSTPSRIINEPLASSKDYPEN